MVESELAQEILNLRPGDHLWLYFCSQADYPSPLCLGCINVVDYNQVFCLGVSFYVILLNRAYDQAVRVLLSSFHVRGE
jgi:hypothetical protein